MDRLRRSAGEALTHVRHFNSKVKNESPKGPLASVTNTRLNGLHLRKQEYADEELNRKSLDEHIKWEVKEESEGRRLFSESADQAIGIYRKGQPSKPSSSPLPAAITESDELKAITKELEAKWKTTIEDLIQKRGAHNKDLVELANDPTPDRLETIVRKAQDEINEKKYSRGGRVKEWFRKVATTIQNHEYLLELLPSGDKYTSVLVGGLTACVKATTEHEDIAELISDCLEKLSDKTHRLFKAVRQANRSEYIRSHIIRFYSTLFGLLVSILEEWLLSRAQRVKNSFGESFRNKLQGSIDNLGYHVKELSDESNDLTLRDMEKTLGQLAQALLAGGYTDSCPTRTPGSASPFAGLNFNVVPPNIPGSTSISAAGIASSTQEESVNQHWTTQTIMEGTAWMREYVSSEREEDLLEQSRYGSTDSQVRYSLLRWTQSKSSQGLWLEGPPTIGDTTPNTLISASIVETFRKFNVPIAAFFCYYDSRYYRTFSRPLELLKMVYALISQILEFIPKDLSSVLDFEDMPDLSPARISRLTPDSTSLPDAIEFLKDIIPLGPPILACCIDGLQLLDSESESQEYQDCFKYFIEVLVTTKPPQPRVIKLWLTTDGHSPALQTAVNAGWIEADITNSEDDTEPLYFRALDIAGAS